MTTYNTGNPVPSADARDRYDNSQTFDEVVNGGLTYYANRIGNNVLSFKGITEFFNAAQAERDAAFQQFLEGTGWYSLGAYAAGLSIVSHTQTVDYLGQPYSLKPSIPASLAAPYVTSGAWASEGANFKLVGDNSLRQDLGTPAAVAQIIAVPQRYNFTNPLLDAAINGFEISLSLFADHGTQLVTDGSVSTRATWLRGMTAAIQFGFTLVPPAGVYFWDTGISLSVASGKSLSIHGQGRINTHIIVGDLTKPALKVTGPTTGFPLSLKGFKFGRLSKETFTQQKLMLIEYPDNFDISGLELYNSVGWALQLSYAKNGAVRDSLVRDGFLGQASDGVHIYREAFNIDIINVEARNLGDDAFSVGHGQADGKFCEGVRFINCKAYNTNGIKIYGACKDIQVLNPHVKLAKYGVSINTYEDVAGSAQGASDILIDGGTLEDITLGAGDQGAITALWNTGTGSGNLKGLTVKGTKIKNTRAGIVCLGQASKKIENLTLEDVTIDGVTGAGVRTDFTSGTLKVKDVTANGAGNQAFYFYNTDATDLWELDGLMANGFGLGSVNVYNGIWLRGNPGRLLMTDCTTLKGNNTTVKSVEMGNVTNSAKHFVLNNRGTGGINMSAGGTLFSPASGQADGTRFVELTP